MLSSSSSGDKGWQSAAPDLAIDHEGPADIGFDHFPDEWIDRPIIELFDQVVARYGDKQATVDERRTLTYRELQLASRHLALRIKRLVGPDKPVGILLPNNALFPVAALACLGAGHPYVPVDPTYPAARIRQIREEAGLAAMIIDRIDGEVVDAGGLPCLDLGSSLGETDDQPMLATTSSEPAIILYTSGSTGRPKGICNDQRAIVQRVAQATNSCHLNASDRFFLLSAPGTIAGVRETFAALLNGATLYVADYSLGMLRVDLATNTVTRLDDAPGSTSIGCDGIVWDGDAIVAVQNGVAPARVVRFVIDPGGSRIARTEVLDRNVAIADEPTIGTIVGREFVYVANSQWEKYTDAGERKRDRALTPTVLLGVPLRR